MVRITTNTKSILRETGLDTRNNLLYAHMDLDSTECSSPLLVRKNDEKFLLVKDIERGNFNDEELSAKVSYYKTYITFDVNVNKNLPADWLELLKEIAADDQLVEVDDDVYTSAYWKVSDSFEIALSKTGKWQRTYFYEVHLNDVTAAFAAGDSTGQVDAEKIITGLTQKQRILNLIQNIPADSRFTALNDTIKDLNLDLILFSSPLNVQEVTGIPYTYLLANDVLAMYRADGSLYVFSNRPIPYQHLQLKKVYQNMEEAAVSSAPANASKIGIEENHLAYKYCLAFGLQRDKTVAMSSRLRLWRESRAWEELPFYVVAAQATVNGMENALKMAAEKFTVGEEFTESDVQCWLYEQFRYYKASNGLSAQIMPYFIVLHAGHRSRKPNLPSFELLRGNNTKTLKIDCGVMVLDQNGLLRGASDLCRTLNLSSEAQELYKYLDDLMISVTIPAALPGKNGNHVYLEGVRDMIAHDSRWIELGLLPKEGLGGKYDRNIGHVMGKQEPASIGFESGNNGVLQEGMVACVEYQWPYYPYAIGVEDMFLITSDGPVNITR
ncbi:MAG: hypothetical protein JL56_10670 [Desulfotomaculum sp. BICA1-6]|nr:MAG: hypothetical protein JL56_10670 [Desulfotomaculum sp. BICA1-6]